MTTVAGGNDLRALITSPNDIIWATNNINRGRMTGAGNHFLSGEGGLATTATDGFPYMSSGAGIPTGVPTSETNMFPFYVNRTDGLLYMYDGTNWIPVGNGELGFSQPIYADQMGNPDDADDADGLPTAPTTPRGGTDGDLDVARFDDTTQQARKFHLKVPNGATRVLWEYMMGPETAPTAPADQAELEIKTKKINSGAAAGTPS